MIVPAAFTDHAETIRSEKSACESIFVIATPCGALLLHERIKRGAKLLIFADTTVYNRKYRLLHRTDPQNVTWLGGA